MNWYVLFIAAAIPLVTGAIWYNPKVLGNGWMKAYGFDPEKAKGSNMVLIFALTYLLSFFLAAQLMSLVVHQVHIFSIFANDPTAKDAGSEMMMFMEKHGKEFRTFKHGAFHGFLSTIMFVLPVIGITSLFERRGAKYIFIHVGYFALTLMLMGGLICATV